MAAPLRVVVADDHPLFLQSLCQLVADSADMELVGQASSGEDLVDTVAEHDPDVVVTDLRMPGMDGIEAIRRLRTADPRRRVLVLTMHDEDDLIAAALQAGARGYTLKESPASVVVSAIRAIGDGLTVVGPGVALAGPLEGPLAVAFPHLTARERDIVALVAEGRTNLAIGRALGITEKTVRNTLSAILTKLRVPDRTTLVDRARNAGVGVPRFPAADR